MSGGWKEIEGCTYDLAYGKDDLLYRRGCDKKIYYNSPNNEWKKLSNMKTLSISATKDSLWVTDDDYVPHKFDELTKTFVRVGTQKGRRI